MPKKRKTLLNVLVLATVAGVASASCGGSAAKRVPPSGDAGEAGEAPASSAGAGARGGSGGTGAISGAGAFGIAGEGGLAGQGGLLGEGGAAGEGGLGGDASSGAAGAQESSGGAGAAGVGGANPTLLLLFNTGVDQNGAVLPGGSVDPHYTLLQSPDPTFTGPDAIVTTEIADGYWLPQSNTSKWIAPSANQSYPGATPCNASGTYVWRTTFDLTAEQAASLQISGGWAADNSGPAVRLNGTSLGSSTPSYSSLNPFTIESGFLVGSNTLDFEVLDVGCPNGLRVELSASL